MNVPLLDLKAQYRTIKNEVDAAVAEVVESQYFILGPKVEQFERNLCQFLDCRCAIGVSSGTDALLLALTALDIGPGDEVIVPTFSFFATAGVVARLHAVPVFVDIDPVTFNLDPREVERKISPRTRAVIPVHLFGQGADMEAILEIAARHRLHVIEDAAQAIGARYRDGRALGTLGTVGCYSFFPSKNLGGFGDAGLVVTNDPELGKRLRMLRVHGSEEKYYHKFVGGNFRIDALQAAVLDVKLPHLPAWSARRRANARQYIQSLIAAGAAEEPGRIDFDEHNRVLLPAMVYEESGVGDTHIFNQFVIRVERRDELQAFLRQKDIGTEIYYPVPFHRQECFSHLPSSTDPYPRADAAAATVLALPIYPELSGEQIGWVAAAIAEFVRNGK